MWGQGGEGGRRGGSGCEGDGYGGKKETGREGGRSRETIQKARSLERESKGRKPTRAGILRGGRGGDGEGGGLEGGGGGRGQNGMRRGAGRGKMGGWEREGRWGTEWEGVGASGQGAV